MNPFILLIIVYGLLTLASASILYFSFRGKVDTSGKYFLLSEALIILVLIQVIATNLYPDLVSTGTLFLGNFLYIAADSALLFSIYTLTRIVSITKYFIVIFLVLIYSGFIELTRLWDPNLPIFLFSLCSAAIALATYYTCKSSPNKELNENLFLKWLRYIELGLFGFAILRMASYFTDSPISPRDPPALYAVLFTIFVALSVFRYISYQSLRISWIDPRSNTENLLNRHLMKLVNDKNQFLQALISSNRAIGVSALANAIAHQISQPITGIILQTESVKRDLIEEGEHEKAVRTLNTVTGQLGKLSKLVSNLRRLSDTTVIDHQAINLAAVTKEILEIIEPTLTSEKIRFIKKINADPMISCNPIQIQQVLINLFNNAIEAIRIGPTQPKEITMTISQEDSYAIMSIQDSGHGISEQMRTAMFELYRTTKKDGMGIGLWLSKEIIEKHAGIISVCNSAEGGAIFTLKIPLYNDADGVR